MAAAAAAVTIIPGAAATAITHGTETEVTPLVIFQAVMVKSIYGFSIDHYVILKISPRIE